MTEKGISNKPEALKAQVIVKAVNGASKSQIARDLEINRNTVARILSEAEISKIVQEGQSGLYSLIPQAVEKYGKWVKSDRTEAKDFLQRVKVLPKLEDAGAVPGVANIINFGNLPMPNAGPRTINQPIGETTGIPEGNSRP